MSKYRESHHRPFIPEYSGGTLRVALNNILYFYKITLAVLSNRSPKQKSAQVITQTVTRRVLRAFTCCLLTRAEAHIARSLQISLLVLARSQQHRYDSRFVLLFFLLVIYIPHIIHRGKQVSFSSTGSEGS